MLVEFAIALPLLILVLYALGLVSVNIFRLGKDQLADYVLESEARYAMERITSAVRAAKEIEFAGSNEIKIVYHAVEDYNSYYTIEGDDPPKYFLFSDKDVWETRIFAAFPTNDRNYRYIYAQHRVNFINNPITGANFFGDTQVNFLRFDLNETKKILHIELEMESRVTGHKIKIATAVFVPGLEKYDE